MNFTEFVWLMMLFFIIMFLFYKKKFKMIFLFIHFLSIMEEQVKHYLHTEWYSSMVMTISAWFLMTLMNQVFICYFYNIKYYSFFIAYQILLPIYAFFFGMYHIFQNKKFTLKQTKKYLLSFFIIYLIIIFLLFFCFFYL